MQSLDVIQILTRLVGFNTTSRSSNLALIHFIGNYLNGYGIRASIMHNAAGDRANLYATIGPDDIGGVLLSGHTDVVPVTGQSWDSDPYQLTRRDDNWYGRGSCDMKGFIACVLGAVPQMVAQPLQTPIHLAFSFDEEIGCVGARELMAQLKTLAVKPKWGIIGEPTSMQSIVAHKGKRAFRVTFTGFSCHSAYIDTGVNAIEYAAKLVVFIQAMNQKLRNRGSADSGYAINYSTFHTGVIAGGTALNIVPEQCWFDFEIRHLPQDDIEALLSEITQYATQELLPSMQARHRHSDITFSTLSAYPGLHTCADSDCVQLVDQLTPQACTGEKVSFGTEAGLFQQHLAVDCVVCGPGSIEQAHKPNEFIAHSQLLASQAFMQKLVAHLA